MKKFAFLALLLLLYYIAGMYDSPALMMLFLTQLLLMAVMFCLRSYLKKNLTVSFAEHILWAEKNRPVYWRLRIENRGRLPVSKFVVSVKTERRGAKKILKRKTGGSGDTGIHSLAVEDTVITGTCGIYTFRINSLKVFDYLSLFSGKKKIKDEMTVIVFPRKYEMNIDPGIFSQDGDDEDRRSLSLQGNNYGEIRQIREYRPGDPVRNIHWNQTARTGQLWVKEYEEESSGRVRLLLDLSGAGEEFCFEEDCFFTLVYSLLFTLIRNNFQVFVSWRIPGETELPETEAGDELRCREILVWLYQIMESLPKKKQTVCEKPDQNDFLRTEGGRAEETMRITADLSWFSGDRLIYRFSGDKLEAELTEKYFTGDSI